MVALHKRDVVVASDGRATVTVTLTDVAFDDNLVLATVASPFSGVDFDEHALTAHGQRVTVQREVTRRGLRIAAIPRSSVRPPTTSLTWSFRVTNAFPFMLRDVIVPHKAFYQEGPDGCVGRSHVLRIPCQRLLLSLRFESRETFFYDSLVKGLVEEPDERWHGIGHGWVPAKDGHAQPDVATRNGDVLSVAFDAPVVGRRYAIACLPANTAPQASARLIWSEATDLLGDVVGVRSRLDASANELRTKLDDTLERELGQMFGASPRAPSCTIAAFLWNPDEHVLQPVYGRFPCDHWGGEFKYGQGVAGHSFRFNRIATFYYKRPNTLIYDRRGPRDYEWIVCTPLRYGYDGPCVGVVSFAGRGDPEDRVATEFRALAAASPPLDDKQEADFQTLGWRLNAAFLDTLANSPVLSNARRKAVGKQLPSGAPGSSRPARLGVDPAAEAPAASSRRESAPESPAGHSAPEAPHGPSLVPTAQSKVPPGEQAKPRRLRRGEKVIVASLGAGAAVVVALINLMGKGASHEKRMDSTLGPGVAPPAASSVAAPPPMDRAYLQSLLERGEAGLAELSKNEAQLRPISLAGANLTGFMLRGAHLRGFQLQGCIFSSADLSTAWLEDAIMANAQLDNCKCGGTNASRVDLTNAAMAGADFTRANLAGARLSGASLRDARLEGANLNEADLSRCDLTNADLSGVDLRGARGLSAKQVRGACGDENTLMPAGFQAIRRCRGVR